MDYIVFFLLLSFASYSISYLLVFEDGYGMAFENFRNWLGVRYTADIDMSTTDGLLLVNSIAERLRLEPKEIADGVEFDLPKRYGITELGWAFTCPLCASVYAVAAFCLLCIPLVLAGAWPFVYGFLMPFAAHGAVIALNGVKSG